MLKSVITTAVICGAAFLSACNSEPAASDVRADTKAPAQVSSLLDPNIVDSYELAGVRILSDPLQDAILEQRPFNTPSEFHAVVSKYADADLQAMIYDQIFVSVNANTASEANIRLIPSPLTPNKLAHEVDEYRPYQDMKQFERELGKYMDGAAMAKLKRYFFVE